MASFLHSCLVAVSTSAAEFFGQYAADFGNARTEESRFAQRPKTEGGNFELLNHNCITSPISHHALFFVYAALAPNTVTAVNAFICSYVQVGIIDRFQTDSLCVYADACCGTVSSPHWDQFVQVTAQIS